MKPDCTITIPLYTWRDIRKRRIAKRVMKELGGKCVRLNKCLVYTFTISTHGEFLKRLKEF